MQNNKTNIGSKLLDIFITIALLDPANIFLKLKTISFLVTIVYLLFSRIPISNKYVKAIVFLYIISLVSSLLGRIQGFEINESMFYQYLTTFSVLILLLWYKHFDIIPRLVFPSVLLSILTIGLYIVMLFFPEMEAIIYGFTHEHDTIFQLSHRPYLGIEFISCFYTPLVIVCLPYAYSLYRLHWEKKNKIKNLLLCILFMTALFCGGNRACFIGLFFTLFVIVMHYHINNGKLKILAMMLVPVIVVSSVVVVYMAATEKEDSNNVKKEHLDSYVNLYEENPLIIATGMGAGAKFYSKGFGTKTSLVEWQYFEIFRFYGLVGGLFVIGFCWMPMFKVFIKKKNYNEWLPFFVGYSCYMMMSTGNPYLMNSTGMIAVLSGYTYLYHNKKKLSVH